MRAQGRGIAGSYFEVLIEGGSKEEGGNEAKRKGGKLGNWKVGRLEDWKEQRNQEIFHLFLSQGLSQVIYSS